MGGNAIVMDHNTEEQFFAEKVPLQTIGRTYFVQEVNKFITDFSQLFEKVTKKRLWEPEQITSGNLFNGSTSYIMCPNYDSKEIETVKPFVGDIDIVVPKELKLELYNFLRDLEGKELSPDVKYLGCNKPEFKPTMSQINCVFDILFKINGVGELRIYTQVDFEFTDFINGEPSQWARFGHSSNLKDAKVGIKAVHHKYLLRALVGTKNEDPLGIVMLGDTQLPKVARLKIFDVNLGICTQLEVLTQSKEQNTYKQLQRFQFNGEKDLTKVFVECFDRLPEGDELEKLWSFVGLCELIQKYTPKELIDRIHRRYLDLLWESSPERTQELERNNPELDFDVKLKGYEYFINFFGLEDLHEPMLSDYYGTFGLNGKCNLSESLSSFKVYIAKKNYIQEDF